MRGFTSQCNHIIAHLCQSVNRLSIILNFIFKIKSYCLVRSNCDYYIMCCALCIDAYHEPILYPSHRKSLVLINNYFARNSIPAKP